MSRYQPPFTITPAILNQVVEFGELLGHWAARTGRASPLLRKENRIRTIQASLAIEHNSLSTEQVTALMDGKRVLAPAKDIQEVRNAILAYEKLPAWRSDSRDDLLDAHLTLMAGLVDRPGVLRQSNVGVYRSQTLVHMAPPASQVPRLISELLDWLNTTELHPLIASSVFHYEFEFIHPFTDGNGRMGRLWQTLILSQWRPELAWLPVETLIHHQQDRYYQVLGECDKACNCTAFIAFMLEKMTEALREAIPDAEDVSGQMSGQMSGQISERNTSYLTATESAVLALLQNKPTHTAATLAEMLNVTVRTVERNLKSLQAKGKLKRHGVPKAGKWIVLV
nr:Fic family protein [uncultured Enterobacter sp.]